MHHFHKNNFSKSEYKEHLETIPKRTILRNPPEYQELTTVGNTKTKTEKLEKSNLDGFASCTEGNFYA